MNKSNYEHLILFMLATLFYKLNTPAWLYLGAAAILIELDQARRFVLGGSNYFNELLQWFTLKDTKYDLLMDALGMFIIYVVFWVI